MFYLHNHLDGRLSTFFHSALPLVRYFKNEVLNKNFAQEIGIGLATSFVGGFVGRFIGLGFSNRLLALGSRALTSHLLSSRLNLLSHDLLTHRKGWSHYQLNLYQDTLGVLGIASGEYSSRWEGRLLLNKPRLIQFFASRILGSLSIGMGNFLGQSAERFSNALENSNQPFSLLQMRNSFAREDLPQLLLNGLITDSAFQLAHLSLGLLVGARHLRLSTSPVVCRTVRERLRSNEDLRLRNPRNLVSSKQLTEVRTVEQFSPSPATLHQIGPFSELCGGHYDGRAPVKTCPLSAESHGIGAAHQLDGELILMRGGLHQSQSQDGHTRPCAQEMQTPFFVTFKANPASGISFCFYNLSFQQLQESLRSFLNPNQAYGIRISGHFDEVLYRVPPRQHSPYKPLAELTTPLYPVRRKSAELTGILTPPSLKESTGEGLHLHGLSGPSRGDGSHEHGGHILNLQGREIRGEVYPLDVVELLREI